MGAVVYSPYYLSTYISDKQGYMRYGKVPKLYSSTIMDDRKTLLALLQSKSKILEYFLKFES